MSFFCYAFLLSGCFTCIYGMNPSDFLRSSSDVHSDMQDVVKNSNMLSLLKTDIPKLNQVLEWVRAHSGMVASYKFTKLTELLEIFIEGIAKNMSSNIDIYDPEKNTIGLLAISEARAKHIQTLLEQVEQKSSEFTSRDFSNTFVQLAKLSELFRLLVKQFKMSLRDCMLQAKNKNDKLNPQGSTNIILKLPNQPDNSLIKEHFEEASLQAKQYIKVLIDPNMPNALWEVMKIIQDVRLWVELAEQGLQALVEQLEKKKCKFDSQNITNIICSLAKLSEQRAFSTQRTSNMIASFQKFSAQRAFSAQCASNMTARLGKLSAQRVYRVELFGKALQILFEQAEENSDKLTPQDIANRIWGLAKLTEQIPIRAQKLDEILQALLEQTVHKSSQFNPQELANTIWGLGKLNERGNFRAEEFKEAIGSLLTQVNRKSDGFTALDIASTIWGLARLGEQFDLSTQKLEEMLQRLLQQAEERKWEFNSQDISDTIWGLCKLLEQGNLEAESIKLGLQSLLQQAEQKIYVFDTEAIHSIIWGLVAKLKMDQQNQLPTQKLAEMLQVFCKYSLIASCCDMAMLSLNIVLF